MPARWPISRTPRARPDLQTTLIDIEDIGCATTASFVDLDDRAIELAFKLYPWEWMFHDAFGAQLVEGADALDRAAMEGDPFQQGHPAAAVGDVSEPSQSAAGLFRGRPERGQARHLLRAQAALFARRRQCRAGQRRHHAGRAGRTYGAEGFIRQALAPLPNFSGQYPCSEAGWSITRHAACRSARTRIRSPATRRGSCRTRSCRTCGSASVSAPKRPPSAFAAPSDRRRRAPTGAVFGR